MLAQVPVFIWGSAALFFCLTIVFSVSLGYRQASRVTLQRVRRRLTADLHDDIGANLSQLAILSEVLQRQVGTTDTALTHSLATLAETARETSSALNDIVWAMNPQQDTLGNLLRRMRRFASDMLPAAGLEFSFCAPQRRGELRLSAQLRRQVFLIFKEGLNNLARHSGGSSAVIELQIEGPYLTLRISDNGKGFDCAQVSEGNGLESLSRRAQSLGAEFQIHSSPQGTTIFLRTRLSRCPWPQGQHWRQAAAGFVKKTQTHLNGGVTTFRPRPTLHSQPITTGKNSPTNR